MKSENDRLYVSTFKIILEWKQLSKIWFFVTHCRNVVILWNGELKESKNHLKIMTWMKNVNTTYVDVTIIRGHVPVGIGLVSAFIWLIAKESSVGSVSNFDGKEITINQVCQIKTRNLMSVLRTASRVQYIHSYTSITGKYI